MIRAHKEVCVQRCALPINYPSSDSMTLGASDLSAGSSSVKSTDWRLWEDTFTQNILFFHFLILSHPRIYFLSLHCPHVRMAPTRWLTLLYQSLVLTTEEIGTLQCGRHWSNKHLLSTPLRPLRPLLPLLPLQHSILAPSSAPSSPNTPISSPPRLCTGHCLCPGQSSQHPPSILHTSTWLPLPFDKLCCPKKARLGASPLPFPNPLCFPDPSTPYGEVALPEYFEVFLTSPWKLRLCLSQSCIPRAWHSAGN